jgi:hypothetical protein
MIREQRLLLQVEDEGPDLLRADRGDVRAGAVRQQEFAEIADAVVTISIDLRLFPSVAAHNWYPFNRAAISMR